MREAYRQKGWAFTNAESIEQCMRDGWSDKVKQGVNEGCQVYGYLEVNKVGNCSTHSERGSLHIDIGSRNYRSVEEMGA